MEGRTVGSSNSLLLDSDQTRCNPKLLTLLKAGIAGPHALADGAAGAALAYIPPDSPGRQRAALFALGESDPLPGGALPGAELALRHLAGAFYASLCHDPGRALESAVNATAEYLRTLVWTGQDIGECGLAAVAVQNRRLWLIRYGRGAAYLLRPARGEWRRLEPTITPATSLPLLLEPGDLVLLGSQSLFAQIPERMLKSCLLALVSSAPGIAEQSLAEVLIRLAGGKPNAAASLALVLRCHETAAQQGPHPDVAPLALGCPAGFAWDFPALHQRPAPATARGRSADSGWDPGPLASAPIVAANQQPGPAPDSSPAPGAAAGVPAALRLSYRPLTAQLPAWIAAERRLARTLLPGAGVLAGAGLVGSWLSDNPGPLLVGCSLSGLLLCNATWPARTPAAPMARGSAALAKSRLQATSRRAGGAVVSPGARRWESLPGVPRPVTWAKDRLLLPPVAAVDAGCLDIVSLKDSTGRIVAQVVLLCPPHLLAGAGGHPGGVYVLFHDLISDQQRIIAWLAPGQRRLDSVLRDIAGYGGNPAAAVRWLRGQPEFELASSRLRIILHLDRYTFADPLRKQHLESLEVLMTHVQAVA